MGVSELSADLKGSVTTKLRYVVKGERSAIYVQNPAKTVWPSEEHEIRIESIRNDPGRFTLEKNGFQLVESPTAVKNFFDPQEVKDVYLPEIKALVKKLTGAADVLAFGAIVRSDTRTKDGEPPVSGAYIPPAFGAHIDYDEQATRDIAAIQLGEKEAERWLAGRRFLKMNLWRPITTIERAPLAVCDGGTVNADCFEDCVLYGGLGDPNTKPLRGHNLSYSPNHRWYYTPRMQPHEVLAFKIFDSDPERITWGPHSAFDDPSSPPDAKPRQSIEVRTISIFPD
jgi:hypothetical protein